jgi:hypothetical protein
MELHSERAHAMAIDTWTLVLGAVLAYRLARDPEPRRDERDRAFAARGIAAGYATSAALTLSFGIALGFGDHTAIARLSRGMIAQLLICTLIVAVMVQYAAQLRLYAIHHRRMAELA